jgi:hypothetical protein
VFALATHTHTHEIKVKDLRRAHANAQLSPPLNGFSAVRALCAFSFILLSWLFLMSTAPNSNGVIYGRSLSLPGLFTSANFAIMSLVELKVKSEWFG